MEIAFFAGIVYGINLVLTIIVYKKVEQIEQNFINLISALNDNTEENGQKYM